MNYEQEDLDPFDFPFGCAQNDSEGLIICCDQIPRLRPPMVDCARDDKKANVRPRSG
ncbi:MAG: hypothetical protein ABIL62_14980 [Planctomycetota bacterium]